MKLIILSTLFYAKYQGCPEIMKKSDRPYYCVSVKIDSREFAIPLRHHINHPYAFITIGERGIDYSKAVLIDDPSYISPDKPRIDSVEWRILQKNENRIFYEFRKYVGQYRRALLHKDNPRSENILRFSTLQYFL